MTTTLDALPLAELEDLARARVRRRRLSLAVFGALAVAAVFVSHEVPSWWDFHLQTWMQDRYTWTVYHRETAQLFTWFFNPISSALTWSVDRVESLLGQIGRAHV